VPLGGSAMDTRSERAEALHNRQMGASVPSKSLKG
jgi:hypothetical protein